MIVVVIVLVDEQLIFQQLYIQLFLQFFLKERIQCIFLDIRGEYIQSNVQFVNIQQLFFLLGYIQFFERLHIQ